MIWILAVFYICNISKDKSLEINISLEIIDNTDLLLVECDHVMQLLASHWSSGIT